MNQERDPQVIRDAVMLELLHVETEMKRVGLTFFFVVNVPLLPGETKGDGFASAVCAGGNLSHPLAREAFADSMRRLFTAIDNGERPS